VLGGFVTSLNRPGANITGTTFLNVALVAKGLEVLHEVIPGAIGILINPNNPNAQSETKDLHAAAQTLGLQVCIESASSPAEIDAANAKLVQLQVTALMIASDAFFQSRIDQLVALAARYKLPALYFQPEFVTAGGLMSYGASRADALRLAGVYAGRILKGEKPAELPVQQSTKVELAINLKTAKSLGITVPISILGRADEVIE
jgi:putative tryptophan/tyrosine transport system substrate-binding protein